MKSVAASLTFFLALTACKPTPPTTYQQIVVAGLERGYLSLQDAIAGEKTGQILAAGSSAKLRLLPTDPILQLHDGASDYFANFQLIGLEPGARELRIRALCDCLGARKYMLIPQLIWVAPAGEAHLLQPTRKEIREPNMLLPIHLYQEYELPEIPEAPSILLLHADNRLLGEVIARSTNTTYVYLDPGYLDVEVPYKVNVSPVGKVRVEVR